MADETIRKWHPLFNTVAVSSGSTFIDAATMLLLFSLFTDFIWGSVGASITLALLLVNYLLILPTSTFSIRHGGGTDRVSGTGHEGQ